MRTTHPMNAGLVLWSLLNPLVTLAEPAPTASQVIGAILANRDVPLSVDSSCDSAPIDPSAKTIGDYFSQLVAALQDERFKPGLKVSIRSEKPEGKAAWECTVMFTREDPESPWRQGLTFAMSGAPLKALPKSFRCPGE